MPTPPHLQIATAPTAHTPHSSKTQQKVEEPQNNAPAVLEAFSVQVMHAQAQVGLLILQLKPARPGPAAVLPLRANDEQLRRQVVVPEKRPIFVICQDAGAAGGVAERQPWVWRALLLDLYAAQLRESVYRCRE